MNKYFLSAMVACGACLAWGAQGQTASVPGSRLIGAPVNKPSGSQIGTISETIVDARSGRIEFAVVSLAGSTSPNTAPGLGTTDARGTSSTSTGNSTPAAASSSTPGVASAMNTRSSNLPARKQVAVPWALLKPAPTAPTSAGGGSIKPPGFVFTGDTRRLESAPNFDASTDLLQPAWRQRIFSYYGLSAQEYGGYGAAESPGGSSSNVEIQNAPSRP